MKNEIMVLPQVLASNPSLLDPQVHLQQLNEIALANAKNQATSAIQEASELKNLVAMLQWANKFLVMLNTKRIIYPVVIDFLKTKHSFKTGSENENLLAFKMLVDIYGTSTKMFTDLQEHSKRLVNKSSKKLKVSDEDSKLGDRLVAAHDAKTGGVKAYSNKEDYAAAILGLRAFIRHREEFEDMLKQKKNGITFTDSITTVTMTATHFQKAKQALRKMEWIHKTFKVSTQYMNMFYPEHSLTKRKEYDLPEQAK